IAALHPGAMAMVAFLVPVARRPCSFLGADLVEHAAHVVLPTHRIENEKFRLGSEEWCRQRPWISGMLPHGARSTAGRANTPASWTVQARRKRCSSACARRTDR